MITITSPENFTTSLWKNGKGKTTELAINPNGTMHNFTYRLSIASVVEDGVFSDFSGYQRNLILLTGEGITLTHQNQSAKEQATHNLMTALAVATFDGSDITHGKLVNGAITDFNLMHDDSVYQAQVFTPSASTESSLQTHTITGNGLYFAYSPVNDLELTLLQTKKRTTIKVGSVLKIENLQGQVCELVGENMILIRLDFR